MDKLSTFHSNDTKKLFFLAKTLNKGNFFKPLLGKNHNRLVSYILEKDNYELWKHFFEGNCYLKFEKGNSPKEHALKNPNASISSDSKNVENSNKNLAGSQIKNDQQSDKQQKGKDGTDSNNDSISQLHQDESSSSIGIEIDGDKSEFTVKEGNRQIAILALHLRYLLWEKAIDYYYHYSQENGRDIKCIEEEEKDYELIDKLDQIEPEISENTKHAESQKPVRTEDTDYDDYDEESDTNEPPKTEEKSDADNYSFNEQGQLVLQINVDVFDQADDNEASGDDSQIIEDAGLVHEQEAMIKEYNKVYHNFEYDRETLIKRRKLEKSDKELESNSFEKQSGIDNNEGDVHENQLNDSMSMNLGVTSVSLRNLFRKIQTKREEISLNDYELRNLFMDVRKNRGKWASDERIGQEELYEALEKVVLELRGYTEHSTPFLNKVSKREAPNYGLIIKHPMDLNTVMKKLKNFQYNSKQEFTNDLLLIWNNCLTYNADPKHYLRAHAIAMQKRTMKLIPSIPNITIRDRADVEKEEEQEIEEKVNIHGAGKGSKKGRKTTKEDISDIKEETEISEAVSSEVNVDSNSAEKENNNSNINNVQLEKSNDTADAENEEEEDDEDDMEIDQRDSDHNDDEEAVGLEVLAWRSWTAKSRAHYCAQRSALFDEDNHLRSDALAICRDSNEMRNFSNFLSNVSVISKGSDLLEMDEPYLLEYDVSGGIPGHEYSGVSPLDEEMKEQELVNKILQQANGDATNMKSPLALPTDSGLNKIYFNNIQEMREIRRICFKISLIRQMQTQQFVHHTQFNDGGVEMIKEVDVDPISQLSGRDIATPEVQYAVLRRNVLKVIMQTGFETANSFAVNTITQLAETYLGNLAKSLKMHHETFSFNRLSPKEILLTSLLENGVEKPDDLYTYVKERILKQLDKLKDLRSKLSNFLKDLLRPGLENFSENSFEDNSEQFMTGDFSSDLGDDFFGFRELGLDKEYKMLSSSIPIYLLHSRLNNSYNSGVSTSKKNKYDDLKLFKIHRLYASDIEHQVKILAPFLQKLLEKSKAHYVKLQKKKGDSTALPEMNRLVLTEDSELPQKQRNIRPRLPPTGKISSVKKKLISQAFLLSDDEVS